MEKSWNNHGIVFLNFCGNPDNTFLAANKKGADQTALMRRLISAFVIACNITCNKIQVFWLSPY